MDGDGQVLGWWVGRERFEEGLLVREGLRGGGGGGGRREEVRAESRNLRDEESGIVFEIDHWIGDHPLGERCILLFQSRLSHDVSTDYSL